MSYLKFSRVKDKEISPYKLANGINIYSVEEAIYLFYNNFKEYSTDFFEDKFINWVNEELLDTKTANKLLEIKNYENFYQKSIDFLTLNNFYLLNEIENISLELFNWEKRGQIERIKIKCDRFFKLNMFEKAIQCYKDALDFDTSNYTLYNNIGVCYIRLKQFDLALVYLKKAINLSNDINILFNIIEVLIEKEDFENGKDCINKLTDDLIYFKHYYLGELYFKAKEYDNSKSNFIKAYLLRKSDNILLKLANIYIEMGYYDKVNNCLKVIGDTDIDILILKSDIYEKINNIPMAIKCIEKANFYNRDNYILWLKLAKYYRKEYNLTKAEGALYKAYTLEPNNEEILYEQALIKKSQGKFKEYQNRLFKIIEKSMESYKEKLYINNNK